MSEAVVGNGSLPILATRVYAHLSTLIQHRDIALSTCIMTSFFPADQKTFLIFNYNLREPWYFS